MIQETIVTTHNNNGKVHIAPMGIHIKGDEFIIMPFRPSTTLDNILETKTAVLNYTDDVRIFAGCLTGRRNWPLQPTQHINGYYLQAALAHCELQLIRIIEDASRPQLICKAAHTANHAPFLGFNRAQFAVLEAAILVTRLRMLPWQKIAAELDYLRIGLDKTAGEKELTAWSWLMQVIEEFKQQEASDE